MNETEYYKQQREIALQRDSYQCQVCGKPATQIAHEIPKAFKKKYTYQVIHHNSNLKACCNLECNKKIEIKHKGGATEMNKALDIIAEIMKVKM